VNKIPQDNVANGRNHRTYEYQTATETKLSFRQELSYMISSCPLII
jgi:hypothetical protein